MEFPRSSYSGEVDEVLAWAVEGCPSPPPPFIKALTLKSYVDRFRCKVFIETGTGLGASVMAVASLGIECHTVELDTARYFQMKDKLSSFSNIQVHHGDSAAILPQLLGGLKQPTLFWLDAHYSWDGLERAAKETPIEQELRAVLSHPVNGHIILIDDIRLFGNPSGEYYRDYPTVDWLYKLFAEYGRSVSLMNDIMRVTHSIKEA